MTRIMNVDGNIEKDESGKKQEKIKVNMDLYYDGIWLCNKSISVDSGKIKKKYQATT